MLTEREAEEEEHGRQPPEEASGADRGGQARAPAAGAVGAAGGALVSAAPEWQPGAARRRWSTATPPSGQGAVVRSLGRGVARRRGWPGEAVAGEQAGAEETARRARPSTRRLVVEVARAGEAAGRPWRGGGPGGGAGAARGWLRRAARRPVHVCVCTSEREREKRECWLGGNQRERVVRERRKVASRPCAYTRE